MFQMKGLDKTLEKQLSEVETATFQKRNKSSVSEDNPKSWEDNEEDARNVYQGPRRNKKESIKNEYCNK